MSNQTQTARVKPIAATQTTIYNLSMPSANTEYSQSLSNSTKAILVKTRDRTARVQIAFVSGDTDLLYVTIEPGAVYFKENLDLTGATIFVQANKSSQVCEIQEWT